MQIKTHIVRIVAAVTDQCWYADKIGKCYGVIDQGGILGNYTVAGHEGILKKDAEIINPEETVYIENLEDYRVLLAGIASEIQEVVDQPAAADEQTEAESNVVHLELVKKDKQDAVVAENTKHAQDSWDNFRSQFFMGSQAAAMAGRHFNMIYQEVKANTSDLPLSSDQVYEISKSLFDGSMNSAIMRNNDANPMYQWVVPRQKIESDD